MKKIKIKNLGKKKANEKEYGLGTQHSGYFQKVTYSLLDCEKK